MIMKNTYKHLFMILIMASALIFGLHIGQNTALASHDQDEPNGWVCPENPDENQGVCEENWNATTCTWGNGCSTGVQVPGESP
jgi:hypothetical protein